MDVKEEKKEEKDKVEMSVPSNEKDDKVEIETKSGVDGEVQKIEKSDEDKEREFKEKIYNELGLKADDKNSIEMFKKFLKLQESDKIAEDTVETEKARAAELENKLAIAEFKAEVLKAGVRATYVDDAVTLMLSKKTSDDFKVNEVIKEFKTKYPVWFIEENREGTGGVLKSGQSKSSKDDKSLGARLAASRHKTGAKKTYFS